jgi:hypothetical protein
VSLAPGIEAPLAPPEYADHVDVAFQLPLATAYLLPAKTLADTNKKFINTSNITRDFTRFIGFEDGFN